MGQILIAGQTGEVVVDINNAMLFCFSCSASTFSLQNLQIFM